MPSGPDQALLAPAVGPAAPGRAVRVEQPLLSCQSRQESTHHDVVIVVDRGGQVAAESAEII